MTVATDRWTCPRCLRTVVIVASPADTRCCIAAAQMRHAAGHAPRPRVARHDELPEPKTKGET